MLYFAIEFRQKIWEDKRGLHAVIFFDSYNPKEAVV